MREIVLVVMANQKAKYQELVRYVVYAIFRYLYLIQVKHCGGEPEEILLSDRPFQIAIALWGLTVLIVFYLS